MQEKYKIQNPPKNEKKNCEREIPFCVWENYVQNEIENFKFIVK